MGEFLYYVYHLSKTQIEVIGITEEINGEVKGKIIDSNFKDDVGCGWSNRKSHLNSPEYDFSKEYIPIRLENIDKLNLSFKK